MDYKQLRRAAVSRRVVLFEHRHPSWTDYIEYYIKRIIHDFDKNGNERLVALCQDTVQPNSFAEIDPKYLSFKEEP